MRIAGRAWGRGTRRALSQMTANNSPGVCVSVQYSMIADIAMFRMILNSTLFLGYFSNSFSFLHMWYFKRVALIQVSGMSITGGKLMVINTVDISRSDLVFKASMDIVLQKLAILEPYVPVVVPLEALYLVEKNIRSRYIRDCSAVSSIHCSISAPCMDVCMLNGSNGWGLLSSALSSCSTRVRM